MSIELLIGAVIVIAVVAYFVFKDSKDETSAQPTLKADLEEAAKVVAETKKAEPAKAVKAAPAKKAVKKTATKKTADLSDMSKNDLLAHAKKNGIKANASMKKADILAAINNG
jgi:hypothetical protein